jgi:hypothetical protein
MDPAIFPTASSWLHIMKCRFKIKKIIVEFNGSCPRISLGIVGDPTRSSTNLYSPRAQANQSALPFLPPSCCKPDHSQRTTHASRARWRVPVFLDVICRNLPEKDEMGLMAHRLRRLSLKFSLETRDWKHFANELWLYSVYSGNEHSPSEPAEGHEMAALIPRVQPQRAPDLRSQEMSAQLGVFLERLILTKHLHVRPLVMLSRCLGEWA